MRRLALLPVLLLAPALAGAQSFTVTESNPPTESPPIINADECSGKASDGLAFQFTIPITTTISANPTITLWAGDLSGCPDPSTTSGAHRSQLSGSISGTSSTSSVSGSYPGNGTVSVPSILSNLNINCSSSQTAVYFCAVLNGTTTGGTTPSVTTSVRLDLQAPPAPVITSVTPGDGALVVSWDTNGGTADGGTGSATSYRIVATDPADTAHPHTSTVTNATTGRVEGLTNDVTYDVDVVAVSSGGNESAPSDKVQGMPQAVRDFWREYQSDGGRERGGCGLGGTGLAALLALLPLAWRWRRGRPRDGRRA